MTPNDTNEPTRYPLTPTQQGMLFNSLYAPDSGVEIEQVVCSLGERLNVAAFARAWESVVGRHDILRVGFRWEGLAEPLQQVEPRVELSWETHDLRQTPDAERRRRLDDYLSADRRRGFDLRRAPAMRFALFHFADDDCRFVWTFHHALLDLRGIVVTLREAFDTYEAFSRGEEPRQSEPCAFSDYVEWLAGRGDSAESERFWRETLEGFRAPTPLPQRPATAGADAAQSPDSREHSVRLSRDVTARLKSVAGESGVTLSVVLLAAWSLLLSRYSGEDDVVFGTTRTCRGWGDAERTAWQVGLFVNTLPFRARVPADASLPEWLGELRAQWRAAGRHVHTPVTLIQECGEVKRGTPLFESILVHAHEEMNTTLRAQGGAWGRRNFQILSRTGFPLTLASYGEEELLLKLKYDPRRFGDETPARMLEHFAVILRAMAENPARPVSSLAILSDEETRRQLFGWNATAAEYPSDKCAHELFAEQAARTPEAEAVVCGSDRLTYAELDARSSRLAARLRSQGVGPESFVGLLMNRSAELVVAMLGVLKAGAAYVPLAPEYPRERLRAMVEDAGARVVLTQARLSREAAAACEGLAEAFDIEAALEDAAIEDAAPARKAGPRNAAYVIYTSGSTGRPKGVAVEHRGLVNLCAWHQRTYGVEATDRATHLAGISFDASVWEVWPYLTAGASVHVVDEEVRVSPARLVRRLADEAVTLCFLPTPLAELVLNEEFPADMPLRAMLVGGEKLKRRPKNGLPFALVNHYGPTETTVVATSDVVLPTEEGGAAPSIGRPISNTQVYILDAALRPVPAGAPGELYIGGDGLARGYLGRPELTAEKFVPNPFSNAPGARLYRTGDLGRYLADGRVEFLGRADGQVKVRGHRIELGEIEAALASHAGVRQCALAARADARGELGLVAYVVGAVSAVELRSHLKASLPEYMVPSVFVALEELPLTPNGKVDRKRLPEPEPASPRPVEECAAPLSDAEQAVANIWREVLKIERVGADDNFFELGGHSLLATRVISRISQTCRVELTLRSLFEWPTLRALSSGVEAAKLAGEKARTPIISRAARSARA